MEIVMLSGFPGSGKSTLGRSYDGYTIISRDNLGKDYKAVLKELEKKIEAGENVVLDNTNLTVDARKPFIDMAKKYGAKIKCVWIDTDIETCFINVLRRNWERYGNISFTGKGHPNDPNIFSPAVLFSARKNHERPMVDEGFDSVDVIEGMKAMFDPAVYTNRAVFFDIDGTLRKTDHLKNKYPTCVDEVELYTDIKKMKKVIGKYKDHMFFGVSNQSGISKGVVTEESVEQCMNKTKELLDVEMEIKWCPHRAAPITCYCRKPQSGMGVYFIEKYRVNPRESIMVGDQTTDKTFATRLGMRFIHVDKFFD